MDLLKRRIQAKQDMEADPAELERISESAAEVEKQRQEVLKTIEAHREAVNKYEYMAAQQTTKQALGGQPDSQGPQCAHQHLRNRLVRSRGRGAE